MKQLVDVSAALSLAISHVQHTRHIKTESSKLYIIGCLSPARPLPSIKVRVARTCTALKRNDPGDCCGFHSTVFIVFACICLSSSSSSSVCVCVCVCAFLFFVYCFSFSFRFVFKLELDGTIQRVSNERPLMGCARQRSKPTTKSSGIVPTS